MATPNKSTEQAPQKRRKLLVSSAVYGYEELLESIYALLSPSSDDDSHGYEVIMSHKGTLPVDPNVSALNSCLKAVEDCDLFLGIILPRYGSGIEEDNAHEKSITHRELLRAIELNKPHWFLVHEHVVIARHLLEPYRDASTKPDRFTLKSGLAFEKTPFLSDLRVLEMYEAAMRHDIPDLKDRKGNWVQTYSSDDDARLFAMAQFRRNRDLEQRHLPKLKNIDSIQAKIDGTKGAQS